MGGCSACKREQIDIINRNEEERGKRKNNKAGTVKIDIKNFISENSSAALNKSYQIIDLLGEGAFGTVYKVIHKDTKMFRAMKVIKRSYLKYQDDEKKFLKEIEILTETNHPNIIKLFEYFTDNINYYIIIEYFSKGNLQDTLQNISKMNEGIASTILFQLFSAVFYIHSKNILHRDIKAENILVEDFSDSNLKEIKIKLSDFGTSNYIFKNENLVLKVGTPYYIAPEVLKKKYNEKCDVWSCGVLMYFLLTGGMPFNGLTITDIKDSIIIGKFDRQSKVYQRISQEAKDLLDQLLAYDYEKRASAGEALKHPWFSKFKREVTLDDENFNKVLSNIKRFKVNDKLQLAGMAFIVHFIETNEEIAKLIQVFKKMDKNGDGRLTISELHEGLSNVRGTVVTDTEMIDTFKKLDMDKNGFIEYEEFIRASIDRRNLLSVENLKIAFNYFDKNSDGMLNKEELKQILGTENDEYCLRLIQQIDKNDDGKISFDEFANLMKESIRQSTKKNFLKANTQLPGQIRPNIGIDATNSMVCDLDNSLQRDERKKSTKKSLNKSNTSFATNKKELKIDDSNEIEEDKLYI